MNKQTAETIEKIKALGVGSLGEFYAGGIWIALDEPIHTDELKALVAELEKYRAALEDYADEKNWQSTEQDEVFYGYRYYTGTRGVDGIHGYTIAQDALKVVAW